MLPSRRREFCHFADALSPSLLAHLLKVEGGAAEWQSHRRPGVTGGQARNSSVQASIVFLKPWTGRNPEILSALRPPELKVSTPARTKHPGWHVGFEFRVAHPKKWPMPAAASGSAAACPSMHAPAACPPIDCCALLVVKLPAVGPCNN